MHANPGSVDFILSRERESSQKPGGVLPCRRFQQAPDSEAELTSW